MNELNKIEGPVIKNNTSPYIDPYFERIFPCYFRIGSFDTCNNSDCIFCRTRLKNINSIYPQELLSSIYVSFDNLYLNFKDIPKDELKKVFHVYYLNSLNVINKSSIDDNKKQEREQEREQEEFDNLKMFFDECKNISMLFLYKTNINKIPENLITLTYLIEFDCSNNNIKELPDNNLYLLKHLRSFSCSHNEIIKISTLPNNLESFYCNNNNISILPEYFPKSIRYIDLSNNNISKLPQFKGDILETFYCHNNKLKTFPECYNFKYLYDFNITDNLIEVLPEFDYTVNNYREFLFYSKTMNNLYPELYDFYKVIYNKINKRTSSLYYDEYEYYNSFEHYNSVLEIVIDDTYYKMYDYINKTNMERNINRTKQFKDKIIEKYIAKIFSPEYIF